MYTMRYNARGIFSAMLLEVLLFQDNYKSEDAMAKVTTGTGDTGYTGLLGEQRVPKYDARPETFGTVDEATSALGLARATASDSRVKEIIYGIQQELYLLMGELATPAENYEKMGLRMTVEHVQRLEQIEEELKQEVEIPNKFIIPGDTPDGAALDLARTIIRRAERMAVRLLHEGVIENSEVVRYLNRLSDLIFILARYVEVKSSLARLPE
jgi:cob(I)alamin adenosyltransferase